MSVGRLSRRTFLWAASAAPFLIRYHLFRANSGAREHFCLPDRPKL